MLRPSTHTFSLHISASGTGSCCASGCERVAAARAAVGDAACILCAALLPACLPRCSATPPRRAADTGAVFHAALRYTLRARKRRQRRRASAGSGARPEGSVTLLRGGPCVLKLSAALRACRTVMSSDEIALVRAFSRKATELMHKGHLLRASENYGRAAEAAGVWGADNIVTAGFQMNQAHQLGFYAVNVPHSGAAAPDPRVLAAHRAESVRLHSAAVATLERRRVAGTLLPGTLLPAEEAWSTDDALHTLPDLTAAQAASWAPLYGYEIFLEVACSLLDVLGVAREYAAECSGAQFQSFAQHVVNAAELMQLPRINGGLYLDAEASFVKALRLCVAVAVVGAGGLDARLVQLLVGAWHRLQRSGVLQARHIEERIRVGEPKMRANLAAFAKSLSAPGLRTCALPGCGAKEAHPQLFKSCGACRSVAFCCKEHQVEDWPNHKAACKAARKAQAAEEDEAGPSGA